MLNPFKERLLEKKLQPGLWMSLSSASAVEIATLAGADWLLLDMEHAPNEVMTILDQIRAIPNQSTSCIVRPPQSEKVVIKRLLDIGVKNIMFPMIETADQAREAVTWTRYPPYGVRGYSGVIRANGYGTNVDYLDDYAKDIGIIIQVESETAIRNIPKIASIKGVDAIFIGPGDLMSSLGKPGATEDEKHSLLVNEGLSAIKEAGISAGILGYGKKNAIQYFSDGFDYVAVGADTWMLSTGFSALLQAIKHPDS